jgi:hypothetical protein
MRDWKAFFKSLAHQPLGFSADGRMVGLSLSAAMEEERQRMVAEVEDYLHGNTAESRGSTTSF